MNEESCNEKTTLKTPFFPGNKFWEARSKHGRNPIFENPDDLWEACTEYFEWVHTNPLVAIELVKYQGNAKQVEVPKMRAMTISGLCLFLDITEQTWRNYKGKSDFLGICEHAEKVIYNQKFQGAAAELLNPNIIARDLGLRDRVDSKITSPIDYTKLSEKELDRLIQEKKGKLKAAV